MIDAIGRRTNVLLIEDSDSDAELFELVLHEAAGTAFDVARASSLAEATAHLERSCVDCAVVDLGLPDADGLEIIETLAARCPALPLVVLTGREDDELGLAAIEAGASDYLPKSALDGKLLVRSLRHAILRKRFETSLAEAQSISRVGSWEMDIASDAIIWSRELCRLFDYDVDERPSHEGLIDRVHPDDREALLRGLSAMMEGLAPLLVEHRILLLNGTVRWVCARGRMEVDALGRPLRILATFQDITEQKFAEEALLHHAYHDPLSGLPNRLLFLDRLGPALHRLDDAPSTVGVVYLDVDRFKVINASLGHEIGDQLLLALATRLASLVCPGDTLGHMGGDGFVVLCEGLSGAAAAVSVADRICAAMSEPLAWDGGEVVLSVSAGIAVATSASVSPTTLLRDADAAMYRAKIEGRSRSAVFNEGMRITAVGRLDTEMALRQAITNGELCLHYQPIVNLADGDILGHEALVRWNHPTRGLLGPQHFIAIAEETGLIVPLGAWVIREACLTAKQFQARDQRWSRLTMAVNLSGGQLGHTDVTELVQSALQDADLEPQYLQLEMTESILMDDAAATITILRTLKSLGVSLSVDDFGTGYSSLAYLKRFPVDVLKIDRSFVHGLGTDSDDAAIAGALVSLAEALGLTAIAEGVETVGQRNCLVELGCTRAQGYLFARPADAFAIEVALDRAACRPRGRRVRRDGESTGAITKPDGPGGPRRRSSARLP